MIKKIKQRISSYTQSNLFIFLSLCLFSYLLFARTFSFDFIIDDWVLLWTTMFHLNLYGVYWGHPATVVEFFVFTKLFDANQVVFNIFGIFLRALSGFVGFLFVTKFTKSKNIGFFFSLLLVTTYIGLQATTFASAHIVLIDLILITYTSYRFLFYYESHKKSDGILFLLLYIVTMLADPGRNFPLIIFLCYLWWSQEKKVPIQHFLKKKLKKLLVLLAIVTIVFLGWDSLFGYFFNKHISLRHIPIGTIPYFFGSLVNMLLDPFQRTFEFAIISQSPLLPFYGITGIIFVCAWLYSLWISIQKKSLLITAVSVFFFWMFVFYIPSWISYPRTYVTATFRYLTISGFGMLGIATTIVNFLYRKNKFFGLLIGGLLLLINLTTLEYHISQEASFHGKNLPHIWKEIEKNIPKNERDTIFYFTGDEPLLTWGVVYSEANPYRLTYHIADTSHVIIATNRLGKIVNYLCHTGITSKNILLQKIPTLHFRSWNITKDGVVTNTTTKELQQVENVYNNKYVCTEVRQQYGDTFTYFN